MYLLAGKQSQARNQLERALNDYRSVGSRRGEASALHYRGMLNSVDGEPAKALRDLSRSLQIRSALRLGDDAAETQFQMGRIERGRGHLGAARGLLSSAIRTAENLRTKAAGDYFRSSYFASKQRYYQEFIDLTMQTGLDQQAFEMSERGRARALLDALSGDRDQIREGADPDLLRQEHSLEMRLNLLSIRMTRLADLANLSAQTKVRDEFDKSLREYRQMEARMQEVAPRYSSLVRPTPASLRKIQESLSPNTVLLEFSLGERASFVWAVTRGSLLSSVLPGRAGIESDARAVIDGMASYRNRIRNRDSQEAYQRAAVSLGCKLLAGIGPHIKDKKLLIVSDGILHYVPFTALPDPNDPSHPLGIGHEVSFLPSASIIASTRVPDAARVAQKSLAVFGYPVYDKQDPRVVAAARTTGKLSPSPLESVGFSLPPLPFTRREAEDIAAVVPGAWVNLGFQASKRRFTSPETSAYRYLHIAAHARVDDTRPELSGLVFSLVDENGNEQDGFLRLFEIINLRLPAELVVASACETALGKDVRGEGIIGLARGFFYAGAKRVVVSLWPVRDDATAEFMRLLYEGMFGSPRLTPAAALRRAQEQMWNSERWRDPFFWSGFMLQQSVGG
jgi:CHAT domain-containing protein